MVWSTDSWAISKKKIFCRSESASLAKDFTPVKWGRIESFKALIWMYMVLPYVSWFEKIDKTGPSSVSLVVNEEMR